MVRKKFFFSLAESMVFLLTISWLVASSGPPAYAIEKAKDLPPRAIEVAPEYTGIVVPRGEDVSVDVTVANKGRRDEDIAVSLAAVPEGWSARIKTYSFGVTGVHVKSDSSKSLTLKANPGKEVGPGKYIFDIVAKTSDGALTSSSQLAVQVEDKEKENTPEGVDIVTSYPVLRGPTDGKFEFSLEVKNKSDKDGIFNLASQGPENWEINFKPAYEDKFISSLRLKANESKTMAVEVKPYPLAGPGRYPILVKVASPQAKGQAALDVVLTGTHKLDIGTPNGLLSLNAQRGEMANLSFYVKNSGSAPMSGVHFMSFKPENWEVKFSPEKIDTLAPDELKQVEVTITPSDQALVGDYSVGLSAEAGNPTKVNKNLELRVTVSASTMWGWIGIGIIGFVILGLVVLFVRLGRR